MGVCKNCESKTKGKRKYCSYKCRNIYVNKNLRDYSKNSKGQSKIDNYIPKKCLTCGDELPYEKRRNKYCNSSCAAKTTNTKRDYSEININENSILALKRSTELKYKKKKDKYYKNPNKCINCNKILKYKKRKNKFCEWKCKIEYYSNKNEYQLYKSQCKFKFNLSDYPDEFNFKLIEKYGWYSPTNKNNNLEGVSRDHIYSVREGFENKIDPSLISHPANCRLMVHNDNISKNKRSDITLKELKNKIINWNEKYKQK